MQEASPYHDVTTILTLTRWQHMTPIASLFTMSDGIPIQGVPCITCVPGLGIIVEASRERVLTVGHHARLATRDD